MKVFIGMEASGALRERFGARGHDVISCDLREAEDTPKLGRHIVGDVFDTLESLWPTWWPDLAVFHPTCTYLTCSAEWAYTDGPYHQKVKPETLVGAARRAARENALNDVRRIFALPIARKVVENPRGVIGSRIRKASQTIQPYQFCEDASKATCLWFIDGDGNDIPSMRLRSEPWMHVSPTLRKNGKSYWANQTDNGQNRLSPGEDRWIERSRTYDGIADAFAETWG